MRALPILILALAFGSISLAACDEDSKSEAVDEAAALMEGCRADQAQDEGLCCLDSDCLQGQICDHQFICSPGPDGGLACSSPSGTRRCLEPCAEDGTCPSGFACQELERFQGSDNGTLEKVCVAE